MRSFWIPGFAEGLCIPLRGNLVCIFYIFRTTYYVLIKFWDSDHCFNRNTLIPLDLKSETFYANRDYATLHITNFLTWYEIETCIRDTFWWTKLVSDFISLVMCFFLKRILVCIFHVVVLPNLLHSNFNLIVCVEVGISRKKLHTGKYFLEKLYDHIHDVINRPLLTMIRLKVSNCYRIRKFVNNTY